MHSYVKRLRHEAFLCEMFVTWRIHMWCVLRHDTFVGETCGICKLMTRSYVQYDSHLPRPIHLRVMTFSYTWLIHLCTLQTPNVWFNIIMCWLIHVYILNVWHFWHDSFIFTHHTKCAFDVHPWQSRVPVMTCLYVWHDLFICVTCRIHIQDSLSLCHSHVRDRTHMNICVMTYSCMRHTIFIWST